MSLEIHMLTMGIAHTNCYIIADSAHKQAIVIDPVDQAPLIVKTAQDTGWTIGLILATHAHFDHVLASKELVELTGAPFWCHADCQAWLDNLPQTGVRFTGTPFPEAAKPTRFLTTEPEVLAFGGLELHTLFTPGHARGHIAFYMPSESLVFSGDALFAGSIGRTDLPGSNHKELLASIREKLFTLPNETRVLSGHGEETTIGVEKRTNPFLT